MLTLDRRAAVVALFVVACQPAYALFGDNEPQRRKAFIDFLQTQIIAKPGLHLFRLTDADNKAFGDYAKHYAVLTDFGSDPVIGAMYKKFNDSLPPLQSIQSLIDQRVAVRKVAADFNDILRVMGEKYDSTKAARDALKQPDDLKAVYDKAFDKLVTAPATAFRAVTPIAQEVAIAAANLGDYAAAHSDSVKVVGNSLQAKDRKTQAELDRLIAALSSITPRFNDARRTLQLVLQGS
jgi:Protein of unknown function (DUF3053)